VTRVIQKSSQKNRKFSYKDPPTATLLPFLTRY
jgi:hypothetical protein